MYPSKLRIIEEKEFLFWLSFEMICIRILYSWICGSYCRVWIIKKVNRLLPETIDFKKKEFS